MKLYYQRVGTPVGEMELVQRLETVLLFEFARGTGRERVKQRLAPRFGECELIEDAPASEHLVRIAAYFETENYCVSQSEDGEGIHRLIAESAIDVVLLDINLPGKDGLQLARELSEKTDVGIILVTPVFRV